MNIVYSSDSRYFPLFFVSAVSLLENNKDADHISIFLLGKDLSSACLGQVKALIHKYHRKIDIVDLETYCSRLRFWKKEEDCRYARLLLGEIINEDKAVYLDCDTMICGSLQGLWETDLSGCYAGAALDTVRKDARAEAGLREEDNYFNSGVLLVNLTKWRKDNVCALFAQYQSRITQGIYRDQRVINACIAEGIRTIHPRYNVLPEMMDCSSRRIQWMTGMKRFYSDAELADAVRQPVVVHFAGKSVDRPWFANCEHPCREEYRIYAGKNEEILRLEYETDSKVNCLKGRLIKRHRNLYALISRMRHG